MKRVAIPITTTLFLGLVALTYLHVNPPGTTVQYTISLEKPFAHEQGNQYKTDLPVRLISDTPINGISAVVLLENGKPLGPAHSARIREIGEGAYLHSGNKVFFSTSDNSDPNLNGRTYTAVYPKASSIILYSIIFIVLYVNLVLIGWLWMRLLFGGDSKIASVITAILNVTFLLLMVEASFWAMTRIQLSESGSFVRELYENGFKDRISETPVSFPGLTINYKQHHYLNYCLNPETPYYGAYQVHGQLKIRRSEPIRERNDVSWRCLVVGGSTTFCEGVAKEQDTWACQLENLIRKDLPSAEVINCGVSGYTIVENLVHYISLLKTLQPDLVMLYTGINDVHARLFGDLASDYSNYRVPWRSENGPIPSASKFLSWSYIYKYSFLNYVVLKAMEEGIGGQVSKKGPKPAEWTAALARNSAGVYKCHLETFVQLLRADNIKVVIAPQVFSPQNDSDGFFHRGVLEHNVINGQVAQAYGAAFVSSIAEPDVWVRTDLLDNCHFSETGCRKMAGMVFSFFKDAGVIPQLNASKNE